MNTEKLPSPAMKRRRILSIILLVLVLAIVAFLRFDRLGEASIGNEYYAAAIKCALQSRHNFFRRLRTRRRVDPVREIVYLI